MSHSVTIPEALTNVAALVSAGELKAARREGRKLLDIADQRSLEIIAECVRILETRPRIAVIKLRHFRDTCDNETDRAIIAACTPKPGEQARRPEPEPDRAPRWTRRAIEKARSRAAGEVRTSVRPELRRRNRRQAREESAVVSVYASERAGVDDAPERAELPVGYAIDYDRAAVPALRGTPCVFCWLERSSADQASGRGDDGLCADCRESSRPGIPTLPAGHTHVDAIEARCAYIAARTGTAAHGILCKEWQRANARDRATIAAWVQTHPLPADTAPVAEHDANTAAVGAACEQCGDLRQVRHGLCVDCRKLDDHAPAPVPDEEAEPAPRAA